MRNVSPRILLPILFIVFLFLSLVTKAQTKVNGTVKGRVTDSKTKLPLEAASVAIKDLKDSSVVQNTATTKAGDFEIKGIGAGSYELWISSVGYESVKKPFTIKDNSRVDLGSILIDEGIVLNVVTIEDETPVKVKKDTVEYNAKSFKTQPNDDTEALLKKLPGVEVDRDGKITVQGKTVNKVLVDGKEFFGNDPKAATKNLPADIIKSVQVIDDKTDQAKKTGIDDGQRDKVINLTLKEDKKRGWFGNAAAAGGSSDRYLGQMNMNHFNKDVQLSFLFMSNNVNQSGFSFDDLQNFSGGDVTSAFGSSDGSISISTTRTGGADINGVFSGVGNGGLIKTNSGGINFSNNYGKKKQLKMNSSYVAVLSSNTISKFSDIQDPLANELIFTSQSAFGKNSTDIHRLNLNINYKMDSLTTIQFKPNFSLSLRKNLNDLTYSSVNQSSSPVNSGTQYFDQETTNPAFNGQFSVNRLLHNGKGSVNMFLTGNYNSTKLNYVNQSVTKYAVSNTEQQNKFNQQSDQDASRSYLNGSVSFVRLLNKAKKLSLTTQNNFQYSNDLADQVTLEYNPVTGMYETLVPALTNNFDNKNWRNTISAGLNKTGEKFTYTLNTGVAYLGLSGEIDGNPLADVKRNYIAFTPNASFSYRKKNGRNFYASISSNVNLPSVSNLQPVFNNTNPLYIRKGNPDLGISRSLNVYMNHTFFDVKNNNFVQIYSQFVQTWNGFSTKSTVDPDSRIQTVTPVNIDGNYSYNLGATISKPSKIKGLRIRYGTSSNIYRNINFINGFKNKSDRLTAGLSGGISYAKDRFSININESGNYNTVKNSFQSLSNQKYYRFNTDITASVEPVKSFRIFADMLSTVFTGAKSSSLSKNIFLVNGGLEKFFMKSRALSLSLSTFDIFNQNSNLQRSVSSTGRIEDFRTNNINRYTYLKLNYKLQKMGSTIR